eukprot:1269652-Prymnesium_polylepis.1
MAETKDDLAAAKALQLHRRRQAAEQQAAEHAVTSTPHVDAGLPQASSASVSAPDCWHEPRAARAARIAAARAATLAAADAEAMVSHSSSAVEREASGCAVEDWVAADSSRAGPQLRSTPSPQPAPPASTPSAFLGTRSTE